MEKEVENEQMLRNFIDKNCNKWNGMDCGRATGEIFKFENRSLNRLIPDKSDD